MRDSNIDALLSYTVLLYKLSTVAITLVSYSHTNLNNLSRNQQFISKSQQTTMSDNIDDHNTLGNLLPMLDGNITWHEWFNKFKIYLLRRCQTACKHIISGVDPDHSFPELDLYRKLARKRVTQDDHEIYATLTAAEKALDIKNWANDATNVPANFDTEDDHFYYRRYRNPKYTGGSGQTRHQTDTQEMCKQIIKYERVERHLAWAIIEGALSDKIKNQIKYPIEEYDIEFANGNYYWLFLKVKFAHTGEGTHSLSLDILNFSKVRIRSGDWISFLEEYWRLRNKIEERNVDAKLIAKSFMDSFFIMALLDPANEVFRKRIEEEIMNDEWRTAAELTAEMQKALRCKESVESAYASGGVIQADAANAK